MILLLLGMAGYAFVGVTAHTALRTWNWDTLAGMLLGFGECAMFAICAVGCFLLFLGLFALGAWTETVAWVGIAGAAGVLFDEITDLILLPNYPALRSRYERKRAVRFWRRLRNQ